MEYIYIYIFYVVLSIFIYPLGYDENGDSHLMLFTFLFGNEKKKGHYLPSHQFACIGTPIYESGHPFSLFDFVTFRKHLYLTCNNHFWFFVPIFFFLSEGRIINDLRGANIRGQK